MNSHCRCVSFKVRLIRLCNTRNMSAKIKKIKLGVSVPESRGTCGVGQLVQHTPAGWQHAKTQATIILSHFHSAVSL